MSVNYTKHLAFDTNGQLHHLTCYSSKGNELRLLQSAGYISIFEY